MITLRGPILVSRKLAMRHELDNGLRCCSTCPKINSFSEEKHEADDNPLPPCTTRTCVSTCARGAGIHGDVLNVHTGTFLAFHTTPHRTHHNTRHNTQHKQHTTTTTHEDRERRQRQREKRRRTRRRQNKTKRGRQEKTRRREKRDDKTREVERDKRREQKIKR